MLNKVEILAKLDKRTFFKSLVPSLKDTGKVKAIGLCPFHDDHNPSLSVNLESGLYHCFACKAKGDVFTFYQKLKGVDFKTALVEIAKMVGTVEVNSNRIVKTYPYVDEDGKLLFEVVRYEPKDFRPRHRGANGQWIHNLAAVRRVLYNLPEVVKAECVIQVEGEEDVDNLKALGFQGNIAVTTSQGGANSWKPEYADCLAGKSVAIIPDNDRAGLAYAETVARSLQGTTKAIKIVELPGLGDRQEKHGLDVSDWIERKRKEGKPDKDIKAELTKLIKDTSPWIPKAETTQQELSPGFVMLDSIEPETVKWLWRNRIPLGKITLVDGDPGLGKSTLALDLAARVSRGLTMPDNAAGIQGGAVLISMEDGLADTIVPRLTAMGADLSKIAAIQAVPGEDGKPRLPTVEDIGDIMRACQKVRAKILIIDPLMAHLSGKVNSFRDQDVRQALTPLAKMAEKLGVAVLVVRHLNKSGGAQSIYRGGGSIGIIGAARCAFLVAKDPEDESRRILAGIKNNLAPIPPSLSFCIEGVDSTSKVIWGGVSTHGADALLAIPSSAEERTALDEAKEFLTDLLSNGGMNAKEVKKEAQKAGISDRTLQRAKKLLDVKPEKQGYQGAWVWVLASKDCQKLSKAAIKKNGDLWGEMATFGEKEIPSDSKKACQTTELDLMAGVL